jgi:hypothetical protein
MTQANDTPNLNNPLFGILDPIEAASGVLRDPEARQTAFATLLTFNPETPLLQLRWVESFAQFVSRDLPGVLEIDGHSRNLPESVGQMFGGAFKDAVLRNLEVAVTVSRHGTKEDQDNFRVHLAALVHKGIATFDDASSCVQIPTPDNNIFSGITFSEKSRADQVTEIGEALAFDPENPEESKKRRQEFRDAVDQLRFEMAATATTDSNDDLQDFYHYVAMTLMAGLYEANSFNAAEAGDVRRHLGSLPQAMHEHVEDLVALSNQVQQRSEEFGAIARLFPLEPEAAPAPSARPATRKRAPGM